MWRRKAAAICKLVCCVGVPIVCKVLRHQGLHRPVFVLHRPVYIVRFASSGFASSVQRKPRRGCKPPAQGKQSAAMRHPGLSPDADDTPRRGKSSGRGANPIVQSPLSLLLPLRGVSENLRLNPGCRSLRSLALGWKLVAPSGRSLNAGNCTPCYTLTIPYTPKHSTPKHFNS